MNDKKTLKKAIIFNSIIFGLEVLCVAWMMSGFMIFPEEVLTAKKIQAFIFFTVDSNVLMGIVALISLIEEIKVYKGLKEEVSKVSLILYLVGSVGVTLTMLVTVFYLTPIVAPDKGVFALFKNANLFFHLINPILSIVVLVLFKRNKRIDFVHTFTGVIPMVLYGIFYLVNGIVHMENGVVPKQYDWYLFYAYGFKSIFIVFPVMLSFTYLISFVLWKINRIKIE